MKNLKSLWVMMVLMVLFVFACVTINIYFPAEKVESVAGDIVDEIRGKNPLEKEESLKNQKDSHLRKVLLALSPSFVWAEEVTGVSNPTIRALKEKMKGRFTQLKPFYQKGMLKEESSGFVSPENTKALGLKEKRDLKNLVAAENKDRTTLYQEVAKALKIDSSQTNKIGEIFAKEWQKSVK